MKLNSELRELAFNAVKIDWKPAVLATLTYGVISYIPNLIGSFAGASGDAGQGILAVVVVALAVACVLPFNYAYHVTMLDFQRGNVDYTVSRMINIVKDDYKRSLMVSLLTAVYVFLWSLLLIIPGIVKGYSYAMTYYIAKDNPNLTAEEAIQASMKVMQGNKMRLFLLDLSFIGWYLLVIVTFGIAALFVTPYNSNAHAAFYDDLMAGQHITTVNDAVDEVATEVVE